MENSLPFQELISRCIQLDKKLHTSFIEPSPTLVFSNTGARGHTKYFQLSLTSLLETFQDIKNNLGSFRSNNQYHEKTWRDLFAENLTEPSANALSTVQTLPLFNLLSKIIHVTNELPLDEHDEHQISLSENHLTKTIDYIASKIMGLEQYENSLLNSAYANQKVRETEKLKYVGKGAKVGENLIYFGAPGTGKSYTIDNLVDQKNTIRTVFHADTQNSDFLGSLKPSVDENGKLTYAFLPGPFTDSYVLAMSKPTEQIYLVIEEINRASAATAFGEIFQLLDRDSDGSGSYQITAADPLLAAHLKENIPSWAGVLQMPSNLSLLATMNSSDQAVLPMDTAFKRRWKFNYIPLDFEKASAVGNLNLESIGLHVSWKEYAKAVNKILSNHLIPEDRHLGPFFLNDADLEDEYSALTGKLFMYLWDDVLRHGLRHIIFSDSMKTYGQLIANYNDNKNIYSQEFLSCFDQRAEETSYSYDLEN